MFTNAYVLVSVLRRTLDCPLPIEIWHFGRDEISPAMAALLAELGATMIDATPIIVEQHASVRDGWQLKPFAMLWSRFEEVLLLDADQVPVIDPTALFDWPAYRDARALFWPDIVDIREDNPVWAALGLEPQQAISLDSAQVLVDKRTHWRALTIVQGLNEQAETLYRLIYGDKDSFLLGWMLAGASFARIPHRPFVDDRMLVQRDFEGRPVFQHRTGSKWHYAGHQFSIRGFVHEQACLSALDALRSRWNGRIFNAPPRSLNARQIEQRLIADGPLRIETDDETAVVELAPHGEIRAGRSYDRQNWYVSDQTEQRPGAPCLIFLGGDGMTCALWQDEAERWTGIRWRLPEVAVTATPMRGDGSRSLARPGTGLLDDLLRAAGFPACDPGKDPLLTEMLVLLDRIEPGVPERLSALADRYSATDPVTAGRLERMAGRVAASAPAVIEPVAYANDVLRAGYIRPKDVG